MPPLMIRRAGPDDLDAVIDLGVGTYREHFPHVWSAEGLNAYLARDFTREEVARQLEAPETTAYLIAERGGEQLGFAKMRYPSQPLVALEGPTAERFPPPPHHGVELQKLYFYGAHTGAGDGTRLLRACVELAATLPHQPLWLCVLAQNPRAKQLYEREGFVTLGMSRFESDLGAQPMWIMARPRL